MNIGIDIRCLMTANKTGVGEYTTELLSAVFALDKINQYYLFYNSANDVAVQIPKWFGDNIHYIHTRWPNKLLNFCLLLFRWPKLDKMIGQKLDLWYAPNLNFTALSKHTKFVLTVHDLAFEFFPGWLTWRQRLWHKLIRPKKQCGRAGLILTPSDNTKRDLADFYKIPAEKIKVVYPGLSSIFYPLSSISSGAEQKKKELRVKYDLPENFILFLGTIEPRKNILGLNDQTDLHLVIAGAPGWKNKKIYAHAAASPVKDKIKFIGYVAPADKPGLYSLASIFVYPSFYEGFGFPILEALSSGVPVITSSRSSLPEIAGSAATYVNAHYPEQIITAINRLLNDIQMREKQIKTGLLQSEKFRWPKAAEEFLKLVNNL